MSLLLLLKSEESSLLELALLIVPVAVDFKGLEYDLLELEFSLIER